MAKPFSRELDDWLNHGLDQTLGGLIRLFKERAFAIIFLILMALPALPLPTGGVTHITELITLLGALQLVAGRRTLWLPGKWMKFNAAKPLKGKAGRRLLGVIKWFERFSRPRLSDLIASPAGRSLLGLVVALLTIAAFVAPPFSGLDTLPALGVVVLSLGMIFEDLVIVLAGVIIGVAGIGLEISAGTALYAGFKHFL